MKKDFSKSLIILGGGVHQLPYVKYCKSNNIKVIVLDKNSNAICKEIADIFIALPISNSNSSDIIESLKPINHNNPFSGVLSPGVELAVLASRIANYFNLKSINLRAAEAATNKILRLRLLKDNNIPIPEFEVVKSIEDANMEIPFVIKKEEGSGSRGVSVIRSKKDLISNMRKYPLDKDKSYLIEKYHEGYEVSIEAFIYNKKYYYYCFSIRDIEILENGEVIEYGSLSEPKLPQDQRKKICNIFEDGCNALGITEGPAKGDILYTKDGPKIIEIAARSAPLAPLIAKKVYGIDMVQVLIKWSLGEEIKSILQSPIPFNDANSICHMILGHTKGILLKIENIEEIQKLDCVINFTKLQEFVTPMTLEEPNNVNRLMYIVTIASNSDVAYKYAKNALSKIKLIYQ